MRFRGRENAVAQTLGEDRLSDSVGGLSCLSCVRTKLHMSTRTSVQSHRVLMKTWSASFISVLFGPYHRNTGITTDTTCCRVIFLSKLVATQVHMPSPRSVQRHWPFQHCFQSLFVLVLHAVRNRTKIESGSFPMSLFL